MGGRRHCACLYRAPVPGRELWRPYAARARRLVPPAHLSAVACHLLHLLDVFRLGRARLAHRVRFPHHLYRTDADRRARLPVPDPRGAARQGAKHHLDRRLYRRALRQEPGGGGDGRPHRHRRHDPLYRAAAQSRCVLGQHDPRRGIAGRRGAAAAWRRGAVRGAGDGDLRGAVRHPPYRRHRTPRRADAGDRSGVDRQTHGVSGRRRVRHLRDVPGAVRIVRARLERPAYLGCAVAPAAIRAVLRHDDAVAIRHRAVAAAVPRHGGREPQRGRDPPRRLDVSGLSGAHQSVRAADRHGRTVDVSGRAPRQRYVRGGAAACRAFRADHARSLHRRTIGRDRHGDHGDGRARHHGVERHRGAAGAQARRRARGRTERRRRAASDHAPHRDLRHHAAGLHLLPLGRRGAAGRHRISVLCRRGAIRAGLLGRADLAARHRGRRHRRHERRHRGVGLYAVAAEHFRRRHCRRAHSYRRTVGSRLLAPASGLRSRPAAFGAWRADEPCRQYRLLYRLLLAQPADRDRARAGGPVRTVLARPDGAKLPIAPPVDRRRGIDVDGRPLSRRGAHPRSVCELRAHPPDQPGAQGRGRLSASAICRISFGVRDRGGVVAPRLVAVAAQAHGFDQSGA